MQSHAGVGIGSGIENNPVGGKAYLLHNIDELTFYITLILIYLHIGVVCTQLLEVSIKRTVAIDTRFTSAEEV